MSAPSEWHVPLVRGRATFPPALLAALGQRGDGLGVEDGLHVEDDRGRRGLEVDVADVDPEAPAVLFHVRTTERSGVVPPTRDARPNVLAREGHWLLSADCGARR